MAEPRREISRSGCRRAAALSMLSLIWATRGQAEGTREFLGLPPAPSYIPGTRIPPAGDAGGGAVPAAAQPVRADSFHNSQALSNERPTAPAAAPSQSVPPQTAVCTRLAALHTQPGDFAAPPGPHLPPHRGPPA